MADAGFEIRPALIRLYFSSRGGDRPKNAEAEFPGVCVTPKGAYEPWMLFRKPISERTVAGNLRRWKTGGLRRLALDRPLPDAIPSGRTPDREAAISDHPCLKPQHFVRILVRALLPLGEGVVPDPFMGSGSTIAAAEAVGYESIGIELDERFFTLAKEAIPRLAALYPGFRGEETEVELDYTIPGTMAGQLELALAEGTNACYSASRSRGNRHSESKGKKQSSAGVPRPAG
jgi:site-specific DNA-methyltransferase (adenine-specific)